MLFRSRAKALEMLGLTEDDLGRVSIGHGTEFEGMSLYDIRKELARRNIDESLRQVRFNKHPEVQSAYDAEMKTIEKTFQDKFAKQAEVAKKINKDLHNRTLQEEKAIRQKQMDKLRNLNPDIGVDVGPENKKTHLWEIPLGEYFNEQVEKIGRAHV